MDSIATIKDWDPPRRFSAESNDLGPNAPSVATEWIVEAKTGGTCTVRVVHSLFASGDDWDDQLHAWESGWPDFFQLLRTYLTHFRGQAGRQITSMGSSVKPAAEAWNAFTDALGLTSVTEGHRTHTQEPAPPIAGVIELAVNEEVGRQLRIRLEEPAPGIAHLFAMPMGGQVCLSLRLYLYGGQAAALARRDQPAWDAWMAERFPAFDPSLLTGKDC
jgi:hypothetical protein